MSKTNSFIVSVFLCFESCAGLLSNVTAQTTNIQAESSVSIESVQNTKSGIADRVGLGDRISVNINGSAESVQRATSSSKKLVLVMDDVALRHLCTNAVTGSATQVTNTMVVTNRASSGASGQAMTIATNSVISSNLYARLDFVLERNEANKADWTTLLGSPRAMLRPVKLEIAVETDNGISIMNSNPFQTKLVLLPNDPFFAQHSDYWYAALILGILILVLLIVWGIRNKKGKGVVLNEWIAWVGWAVVLVSIYCAFGPSWCWIGFFVLFCTGFAYLALWTEMLRDSGPPPPEGKLRPYSLARTQMAIWFFLIIASFVFIWLMTGALDTITGTVLALMGIGAGTALGAEAQNASKLNKVEAEKKDLEAKQVQTAEDERRLKKLRGLLLDVPGLEMEQKNLVRRREILAELAREATLITERDQLRSKQAAGGITDEEAKHLKDAIERLQSMPQLRIELTKLQQEFPFTGDIAARLKDINELLDSRPTSDGFMQDILTDDVGISFHRFQMFVWTVVLSLIFITAVYRQLAMPEFNATLLALMGISAGTYMGFMIAEPKPAAGTA